MEATIEVRRGAWGCPAARCVDPLAGSPVSLRGRLSPIGGDRVANVRVVARFARRGQRRRRSAVADRPRPARPRARGPARRRHRPTRCWCCRAPSAVQVAGPGAVAPLTPDAGHTPSEPLGRDRGRRAAALPAGHAGLADPLAGAGARRRAARAPAARRRRHPAAGRARRPLCRPRAEHLDAAVRAAASLVLELARQGGCGLLLPGERRAARGRPRPGQLGRGPRPPGAGRGRARAPGAGARPRAPGAGRLFYVAAQPTDRLPASIVAGCHGIGGARAPDAAGRRRCGLAERVRGHRLSRVHDRGRGPGRRSGSGPREL